MVPGPSASLPSSVEEIAGPDPAYANGVPPGMRLFLLVQVVGGLAVSAFFLLFAAFAWPTGSPVPPLFGFLLAAFVLGFTVWGRWYFRRVAGRRALSLWAEGDRLHAEMAVGRRASLAWGDPRFSLDIVTYDPVPGGSGVRRHHLEWRVPPYPWTNSMTDSGTERLVALARSHGIRLLVDPPGRGFARLRLRGPNASS